MYKCIIRNNPEEQSPRAHPPMNESTHVAYSSRTARVLAPREDRVLTPRAVRASPPRTNGTFQMWAGNNLRRDDCPRRTGAQCHPEGPSKQQKEAEGPAVWCSGDSAWCRRLRSRRRGARGCGPALGVRASEDMGSPQAPRKDSSFVLEGSLMKPALNL